ncbi:MAG TPA: thioredoxin domain-containing protein [Vicinamibacterales bacterium]|nr:thioredoxin domain-containing protein [Vicinamibacterales bacterium]
MTTRAIVISTAVLFVTGSAVLPGQGPAASDAAITELREIKELLRVLVSRTQPAQPAQALPAAMVPVAPVSIAGAPTKGNVDAALVVIEYADFECPYCGDFARRTLPVLTQQYIATGRVRFAFKHLPLQEIHPRAMMAAAAAECADRQGRFWAVHDRLFNDQQHLDDVSLLAVATAAGVDVDLFRACVQGPGGAKVRQEAARARSEGYSGTPTFLIGRSQGRDLVKVERVVSGTRDAGAFASILDELLAGR